VQSHAALPDKTAKENRSQRALYGYIIKTSSKHHKERNICIHPNMYGKAQRAKTKQTYEFF
jgi:hypothetical protein